MNFSLFIPSTISLGRKLREEYQHATQRCRCGDFSPGFGIYEAASFLTTGQKKKNDIRGLSENPGN